MPPKRESKLTRQEVDSMPELEELPADEEHQDMSVQNMVDRIEGHSMVMPHQFAKLHKQNLARPVGHRYDRLKEESKLTRTKKLTACQN
ncbi:serine/threonine-protein kinase haspin [Dorcoceras hygrometricum]|uniref:Serine/threonine-protein kinase haspin n=1 Tax=Dorcoceras hygrometricum TaxID=472368 RepID=A0A2Z7B259_9LAMI|nr:serine/threonine-protein kinase haspin [Dorcoceras hygrometricum]